MQLNGFWQVFAGGMLGVIVIELLQVASWRKTGKWVQNYRDPAYWITTGCLLIASGFLAAVNGTEQVTLLKALQLGVNAPALFAGYASASDSVRKHRQKKAGFVAERKTLTPWQRILEMRAW